MFDFIIEKLESFTTTPYWKIKTIVAVTILSLTLATPAYHYLPTAMQDENWVSFREKVNNPLASPDYHEDSHAVHKVFRITVPLIAKILFLNNWAVFALQFFVNLLFIYFSSVLVEKITGDKIAAFIVMAGLPFIYAGHAGFTDINTWFDNFAFLFLLLAMLSNRFWAIFIFIQLACWTDERGFFASSFVFIFHKIQEQKNSSLELKQFITPALNSFIVPVAMACYLAGRFFLTHFLGMQTPTGSTVGFNVLMNQTNYYGMGIWFAFEGFWITVILAFAYLAYQRQYILLFAVFTCMLGCMIISFMVFDITRSISYTFPVIFIATAIVHKYLKLQNLRVILLTSVVVCFLFPAYYIIGDVYPYTLWYKPIFVRIIDLIRLS